MRLLKIGIRGSKTSLLKTIETKSKNELIQHNLWILLQFSQGLKKMIVRKPTFFILSLDTKMKEIS